MLTTTKRYPVRGNVCFRERATLQPFYLYISETECISKADGSNFNSLIGSVFVATEFEDGFLINHLCYTDIYKNVFMVKNNEIQELFEHYSPSIYLMANGVILIHTKHLLYATTDLETFTKIEVTTGIKSIFTKDDADYLELFDGSIHQITAFPDFKEGSLLLTMLSATVSKNVTAQ